VHRCDPHNNTPFGQYQAITCSTALYIHYLQWIFVLRFDGPVSARAPGALLSPAHCRILARWLFPVRIVMVIFLLSLCLWNRTQMQRQRQRQRQAGQKMGRTEKPTSQRDECSNARYIGEFLGFRRSRWRIRRWLWPSVLRRGSTTDRLLGLRIRIPPGILISVSSEYCVLSGRGLCDGPILRPEGFYRLWCVIVCDLLTSRMRRHWPALGCWAR
jgi:hypothetical protein